MRTAVAVFAVIGGTVVARGLDVVAEPSLGEVCHCLGDRSGIL